MKKQIKIWAFISVLVLLVISLCSCGLVLGDNAYDLALKNGFSGTEKEWLESLKGEKGEDGKDGLNGVKGNDGQNFNLGYTATDLYNEAVQNGYDKDFLTFIKEVFGSDVTVNLQDGINYGLESSCNIFCYFKDATGTYKAGGSGVFYSVDKEKGDALIITNYHVVYNKNAANKQMVYDEINVHLFGDRFFQNAIPAKFVGGTSTYDLAVLKITGSELIKNSNVKPCSFFDSSDVSVGQNVLAIGNPSSDGTSVTKGVISVPSESVDLDDSKGVSTRFRLIRFDAPVNPGNSGGGLFDDQGRVVGIVNAKLVKENYENIAYAIPSNVVQLVVDNIVSTCDGDSVYAIKKALFGVTVESKDAKAVFNVDRNRYDIIEELYVTEFTANSPVKDCFNIGDKLEYARIKGVTHKLTGNFVLGDLLLNVRVGDTVFVGVTREEKVVDVQITITESMMTTVD